MLEWITTSDFHIGSLKNVFNDALSKQIVEIAKIYDHAMHKGIRYVIIPGDMTDTATLSDYELIELIRLFLRYDEHVITYYIAGNHDYFSVTKSSLNVLECLCDEGIFQNLHIIKTTEQFKLEGVILNMIPFPETAVPESTKPAINFVHMDIDGAVNDNGKPVKAKPIDLGEGNVTVSGHIHQYQELENKRVVYCGNPYQKRFNETNKKGFIICKAYYSKSGLKFTHEFINSYPEFELRTVTIECNADLQKLVKANNIAYKINMGEGMVLPNDLAKSYNIGTIQNAFNTPTVSGNYNENLNLKTGLKSYLTEYGLSNHQIKRAQGIFKDALQAIRQ